MKMGLTKVSVTNGKIRRREAFNRLKLMVKEIKERIVLKEAGPLSGL